MNIHRTPLLNTKIIILIGSTFLLSGLYAQSKGGRWQFEMNGDDSADWDQTNNQGSLFGNAYYGNDGTAPDGNYYLALEDTNRHDQFYVPDGYELDLGNGDVALSAWIYPLAITPKPQYILVKGDHEAVPRTNNYALRLEGENLSMNAADAAGIATKVVSTFTIQTNQWNFVAAFYDYSDSVAYLWNDPNGPPVDTLFFNADLSVNSNRLYIGSWGSEGYRKFTGRIDDVRISTRIEDILVGVIEVDDELFTSKPERFLLNQNYPNPFNMNTVITFDLARARYVTLDVYDLTGRHIANLANQYTSVGSHSFHFVADNMVSGIYLYRLQVGGLHQIRKMILSK